MIASLLAILPTALIDRAYFVGFEAAWVRNDALIVVSHCQSRSIAICGVEVWIRRDGPPEIPMPFVYQWTAGQQQSGESDRDHAARLCDEAAAYIRTFAWDPKDAMYAVEDPYFCLTESRALHPPGFR